MGSCGTVAIYLRKKLSLKSRISQPSMVIFPVQLKLKSQLQIVPLHDFVYVSIDGISIPCYPKKNVFLLPSPVYKIV